MEFISKNANESEPTIKLSFIVVTYFLKKFKHLTLSLMIRLILIIPSDDYCYKVHHFTT